MTASVLFTFQHDNCPRASPELIAGVNVHSRHDTLGGTRQEPGQVGVWFHDIRLKKYVFHNRCISSLDVLFLVPEVNVNKMPISAWINSLGFISHLCLILYFYIWLLSFEQLIISYCCPLLFWLIIIYWTLLFSLVKTQLHLTKGIIYML